MPPIRGGMPQRGHGKPQDTKGTLRRVLHYMNAYKLVMALAFICLLISTGATIAGTYFIKPLINDYILPLVGSVKPDFTGLIGMIGRMAVVYAVGVVASYSLNRLMVTVSVNTLNKLRNDMFEHMQTLPIRYFDAHTHGELMSRYTNDIDAMRQMLSQSVVQLMTAVVTVLSTIIVMILLSPVLTALAIAVLSVMLFVVKKLGGKSGMYFRSLQKSVGQANGYIEEMIEGQKVVKVFSYEEKSREHFEELNNQLFKSSEGANTFANVLMPILGNISYLHYALTAMVGGLMTAAGTMDLGTLASFLQYARSLAQPVSQVSQQFNFVLQALAGAERIFDLLDQKPEEDEGTVGLVCVECGCDGSVKPSKTRTNQWAWQRTAPDGSVSYTKMSGDVRFEDVTFGYEPEKTVLADLSLYAKPGQKIAFVGSTGAGKTTITNLINRFYDVNKGVIRYDGIDVKDIKKADLRNSLAMVLQDTHLFTGTVMENIRYGRLEATDQEVIRAAKLANAHSFIRHLPQGYQTMLTADGANLSQGQRQLLAIARAALADPAVLILDEATSSIDTRTEALIEQGMDELMKGRTVFVIAHRLSTVRNADAIMVLENGKIIERGDHDDLLRQRGKYYQLYTGAFELS